MEILDNYAAVQDVLQCLSPDLPYEDWRNVGFALISEFGREQGGEMFDNWSQAGSKYERAKVNSVIRSADPNGTIRIGTLFHLAKQCGYQPNSSSKSQYFINRNPILVSDKVKTDLNAQERLVTASKAQNIWEQADREVSLSMSYVSRKKITPTENLREITLSKVQSIIGYCPKSSGEPLTGDTVLVAPVWMFTEDGLAISNVELIDGNSKKAALTGKGTKKGGFWAATSLPEGDGAGITILVGEGVATVLSAQHATGYYAVASLSAGNLSEVGKVLLNRYPEADIVMLADIGNGQADAEKAARLINCRIAFPVLPESVEAKDFNDMAFHCGSEAVKAAIDSATHLVDIWLEPEPLGLYIDQLDYPLHALPQKIRDAVIEFSKHAKAPIPLICSSALATVSLVTQAYINIRRDGTLENPVSLYMLTIADSGERKSTCDKHFMKVVRDYDDTQESLFKSDLDNYRADLEAWESKRAGIKSKIQELSRKGSDSRPFENDLRIIEKDKPQSPRIPRLVYGDATPEALAFDLATKWPSGGVMSSEGAAILGGHAMNPDSLMRSLGQLNIIWDGGELPISRRTSESYKVRDVRLTIGLMVQEVTLREFYNKAGKLSRGTGFLARFLVGWPDSTQGSRFYTEPPTSWPARDGFNSRLSAILNQIPPINEQGRLEPKIATFSQEAKSYWKAFYDDIEAGLGIGGELRDVRDVAAKTADNAARLAAIFQFFENGTLVIGLEAIESGCEIAAWHLNEARRFFGEIALPDELAEIIRFDAWLVGFSQKKQLASISATDIMQCATPAKFRKKEVLAKALELLGEKNRLRVKSEGRGKVVEINPQLLKGGLWR